MSDNIEKSLSIVVTRSAGDDRAVLILIDTDFEPSGSDGGPGLRILVNDDEAFVGKALDFGSRHAAEKREFHINLNEILYEETARTTCEMVFDGNDTNGDVWNRCTVHDKLVFGDAYVCEGYVAPPYTGGH